VGEEEAQDYLVCREVVSNSILLDTPATS
jgi:hypothetical protein